MRKIGLVLLRYWLGISVSVIEIARALAADGWAVDVFIDQETFSNAPIRFSTPNINVIVIDVGSHSSYPPVASLKRLTKSLLPIKLWDGLRSAKAWVQYWYLRFSKPDYSVGDFIGAYRISWSPYLEVLISHVAQGDYVALIGIEPNGLMAAWYACHKADARNTHVIYYNLELLERRWNMSLMQRLLKDCEIVCSRGCDFTIIADEKRGNIFAKANGVDKARLRYLPVSLAESPVLSKGRYFRDLFNIPDNRRIVIYAGNICAWGMCREIIESVSQWPAEYVLVMHTWRTDFSSDGYFRELVRLGDGERVFFSTQPVPHERVAEVLSSGDVGLAFYRPIDANFMETGSSSNKLARYAQVGLPVIGNNLPSLRKVFEIYGSGVCIEDPDQIGEALAKIYLDYDSFRQGAFSSYRNHYNFAVAFEPILSELRRLN
jgi:glycosyltransferase involved in cell wall biosynthesis